MSSSYFSRIKDVGLSTGVSNGGKFLNSITLDTTGIIIVHRMPIIYSINTFCYITIADIWLRNRNYDIASSVEKCACPPGYKGLSCEDCAPGWTRLRQSYGIDRSSGALLGSCAPCDCLGGASCDPETGECQVPSK